MSSSKPSSRSGMVKKDGNSRYGTRLMTLEKGKRMNNNTKESNSRKSCDCLLKSENWKGSKLGQNSKVPVKKTSGKAAVKDGKKGSSDHREKVVIVSKRSSSVSVVKSCSLRKSVSVRKVSYSTSVVLSSDEDDDTDTEEESEEEEKSSRSRRRKTVVKRTTSKVKSSYQKSKKSDRAAKKAKAIKLLCDKLSSSNKNKVNERELRPRFPYSMFQEWPTARAHRMASLNALAKVHVLYENEGRTTGENLKDADETSLIDFLNEENSDEDDDDDDDNEDDDDDDDSVHMAIRPSNNSYEKKNDRSKNNDNERSRTEKKPKPPPPTKRATKRKISDVEIIDTRVCKRMASLNAQAILAASYISEPKPKRINRKFEKHDRCTDLDVKVVLESKCDVEIIETEKQTVSPKKESNSTCDKNKQEKCTAPDIQLNDSKTTDCTNISDSSSPAAPFHSNWRVESDAALEESRQKEINTSDSVVSTTASTKVGVTQYTEVTKVQINSRNDLEVKEESKSERKIERILGNDDVAITQMYHYQSKNANESYCVQMQTTYKPGSRNISPASLPLSPTAPMHPHMGDPVLHGRPNYYGCSSHSPMLSAPPYHINPSVGGMHPVMGMDHRIPHQYGGSAFSVPHYRHPQPMQFPHGDYGYYQPAGPLIQPHHDKYTIHKPVPYHPQPHLHQPPSRPQPAIAHRESISLEDPPRRVHQRNTPALPSHASAVKPNSALPLHSSSSETSSHSSYKSPLERSSQERGVTNIKPAVFSTPPKPMSPSSLHPTYPVQSGYRDYLKQKPPNSGGSYSNHCDPNVPSHSHSYNTGLPHNTSYQKNSPIPLESRESGGPRDSQAISHQPLIEVPHHSASYSDSRNDHKIIDDTYMKEPNWSIKTNPEDSPDTPVSFLPYQIDPGKESPSVNMSEPSRYPLRPPSVIEIVEENSRDTKTYIQLEVPKNNYREKIVVVDVENDEINKECDLPNNNNKSHFDISQEKTDIKKIEEISPVADSKKVEYDSCISDDVVNSKSSLDTSADSPKESPEIMVIEIKKKKESAVVRRARLHGKQRTFRDAYNRPLVPLSKVKKSEPSTSEETKVVVKPVESEVSLPPPLSPPKLSEKKFAHGWSWEGQTFEKQVYVSNDESPCIRHCYPAIKHVEGDVINVRDCVLLKSGPRKTDLPFVAKITALWANPADDEMTMSLMWYYRPEHTETEKKLHHMEDEIFASKHKDTNSVACIEDKCYVLTYSEYCRYRKRCTWVEDSATCPTSIVPEIDDYPRMKRLPPQNVSPDLVFFCRKVYDFRQKRLLKNPV